MLWHSCADSGSLDGEPFVELTREVPSGDSYQLKQMPLVMVASAYSGLIDEDAEQAYAATCSRMQSRGYWLAGTKREIYFDQMLEISSP